MPNSAPSRCTRRCGRLATSGGRCDEHRRKAWETPSSNTSTITRSERDRIRKRQLRDEPTCRICGSSVDLEADHIIEIADGGSASDPANLQTLCKKDHDEKSKAERARRAAQRRSLKG